MQILSVRGGAPLRGSIPVSGAKNSVLPILAACAVCRGVSVLHNCPDISDVGDTLEMLRCLGCRAERRGGCVLYEPDGAAVLNTLVSEYVAGKIYAAVKESFASEVAARRMAMDSAEKNAKQMISDLQLSYNRARQSAITQEITEIVAGSGD